MPLMLCQGTLSCRNYAAVQMGSELLCVEHAAALNLKSLLNQKTPNQLGNLALAGFGELPLWAKFGFPRGPAQGPEPKRRRGRPRKWLNANQRWLNWSWKRKGWTPGKIGRPKTARWIGVDDRTRNSILNRELRARRKKQAEEPATVTFAQFCLEEERLRLRRRRRGLKSSRTN
jgi:hypothetical protein